MTVKNFDEIYGLWKEAGLHLADYETEKDEASQMIKLNPQSCLIMFEGKKIIGSVFGTFNGRRAWIYHLAIHPQFQKNGLGKLLRIEVSKALKKVGAKRIFLFVDKSNLKVMGFYKKLGYNLIDDSVLMGENI